MREVENWENKSFTISQNHQKQQFVFATHIMSVVHTHLEHQQYYTLFVVDVVVVLTCVCCGDSCV